MTDAPLAAPADPDRDPDFVRFMRRVGIVAVAAAALMGLASAAWRHATASITREIVAEQKRITSDAGADREALAVEVRARFTADSLMVVRFNRLATIVEIAAVASVEDPGSPERADAVRELRRMRRIVPKLTEGP